MAVASDSSLAEAHSRNQAIPLAGRDGQLRALARSTFRARGHLLLYGPLAAGTSLEGGAGVAVPQTVGTARAAQTTRAGAGAAR